MFKRFICGLVCAGLVAVVTSASAQQTAATEEPLMGSEADPGIATTVFDLPTADGELSPGAVGTDGVFRLLVIGDGLAGGFGAGVSRGFEGDNGIEVINRFNESSGLSRPEMYDWTSAAPKILATREFDAALLHFGINDRQAIRSAQGGFEFKSAEWEELYRRQVANLLDGLAAAKVRIYWVALPAMADTSFDADMQYLNGLYRSEVEKRAGQFIDLRPELVAPDGNPFDRKLRARDGIEFLKQGNNRVGQLLVSAIKAVESKSIEPVAPAQTQITLAPAAPQPQAQPSAEPAVIAVTRDTGIPQFGQEGLNGEEISFTPTQVAMAQKPAAETSQPIVAETPAEHADIIATIVGSAAEVLFKQGISPESEVGRFDDFGIVAAP